MKAFGFHKNTVFEWNGNAFRIERVTPNDEVLLEHLNDGDLSIVSLSQLLKDYADGKVVARPETQKTEQQLYSRSLNDLPEAVQNEVKRRKHYLTAIYEYCVPTFTNKHLRPIIQQVANAIQDLNSPSVATLYRWHRKYVASQDIRSLIPRKDLRGSKQSKQSASLLALATTVIEQAYKVSPQTHIKRIYESLIGMIEAKNLTLLFEEKIEKPSLRTFYRLFASIDSYDKVRLKVGKAAAEKQFRLVKFTTKTKHILERIEIDHTPLDLFLIDENTNLPLGRPDLTVIIDHFSRMLLGYYLSFQKPSTAVVMGALRHAILPKTPKNPVISSIKIDHEWVCYGVPDLMVLDNGWEFHSSDLESVAFDLGIRIQYCPKHEPRFKGVVERYLKTINYNFSSQFAGASFARWHLRNDYDPLKHAILTMAEFNHIFHKWVLDIYSQTKHRGIGTTPWAKWHEDLKFRAPTLPLSVQELKKRIGKVETRTLRRDGILIKGIRYNSDELSANLRAYGAGVKVRVLYDPEDLKDIQVWGPDDIEPLTVLALDQTYARGLTELQNQLIQKIARENGDKSEDRESLQKARYELSCEVVAMLDSSKLRKRRRGAAISGMSSSRSINQEIIINQSKIGKSSTKDKQQVSKISTNNKLPDILPSFELPS
jgi:putative transposase